MSKLHPECYTVGWVCALPIELAAAQEMLDEKHQDSYRNVNDTNIYTLGRIGGHNVVIACLPYGQTGTNSAAAVAVQMKSAFTSIQFVLMVGIGGGVPRADLDIRLGDVVVSRPGQSHGGVVQYDFGKMTESGFKRTGFLNTPPVLLLNAITKLEANHSQNQVGIVEYTSQLNKLKKFSREAAGPDLLFEANYHHLRGDTCEQCDKKRLLERKPRDNEIVVHYGTIASGNQVMRDATERDRVSSELGGVLCFEMEAAGLMNAFPCLVIRGICDYADSHKNKRWQAYAAGTASAYAKEILSVVPPADVSRLHMVDGAFSEENEAFEKQVTLCRNALFLTDTCTSIEAFEKQVTLCRNALFLTDPLVDRESLISTKGKRTPGTCEWITQNTSYQSWLYSRTRLLWISGGPGKGKTMLSIFLTEELGKVAQNREDTDLIFYFCSHQDEKRNTAVAILRGLVYQILVKHPKLVKHIYPHFESSEMAQATLLSLEALWIIFRKLVQDPDLGTTFCVLDGFDECDKDTIRVLVPKIVDMFSPENLPLSTFRMVIISRDIAGLHGCMQVKLDPDNQEQVANDIELFIAVKVQELSRIEGFSEKFRLAIQKNPSRTL